MCTHYNYIHVLIYANPFFEKRRLGARAVAFFVFFAGAAGAGIVAADFGAGADGLGGFGLRGAGLVLQLFLLALLFALHLAGELGQALRGRFAGAGGGSTGNGGVGARARRLLRPSRLGGRSRPALRRLLVLLDLNVEEITDGFVVYARHHVFEENEGFFFKFDERIFLAVAAKADAVLQVVERKK